MSLITRCFITDMMGYLSQIFVWLKDYCALSLIDGQIMATWCDQIYIESFYACSKLAKQQKIDLCWQISSLLWIGLILVISCQFCLCSIQAETNTRVWQTYLCISYKHEWRFCGVKYWALYFHLHSAPSKSRNTLRVIFIQSLQSC